MGVVETEATAAAAKAVGARERAGAGCKKVRASESAANPVSQHLNFPLDLKLELAWH